MIKNYFIVALRNFSRQKFYAILNVIGLASGITCALLIYLWVNDEWQKDKFHKDGEKIFQVGANMSTSSGDVATWLDTPGILVENVIDEIPDVELAVRTLTRVKHLFEYGNKNFLEHGNFADPDFFKIFTFQVIKGITQHSKIEKNYVAISEALAARLFGNEDPIGKTVKVDHIYDLTVTAVFADVSPQSSLIFDFVLPYQIYVEGQGSNFNWYNFNGQSFVLLKDRQKADHVKIAINKGAEGHISKGAHIEFFLQPFTERYLNSAFKNGHHDGGRIVYVKLFSLVAVFILVIACINFMNMATARALTRAKEVGVRKVVGAQRVSLIWQFMTESFFAAGIATLVAIGLVMAVLPEFNLVVSKQIEFNFFDFKFLVFAFGVIVVTGFLSGIYPAFVLSSFHPATVLKGLLGSHSGGDGIRRALVVFQFTLTVVLMASALVVYNQIVFIRSADLGYSRESVLTFAKRNFRLSNNSESLEQEIVKYPGVKIISGANESLVRVNNQTSGVHWPGEPDNSQQLFRAVAVDYGFVETMDLKLLQGRAFSRDFNDTSNFIISKMTADVMGLTEPVGQKISLWGIKGTIVGVINDIHTGSLNGPVGPVILICMPRMADQLFLRFDGNQVQGVLDYLQTLYKRFNPGYPFEYTFLDDDFEKLYSSEKVTGALVFGFTIMAILISGLGLLGLTAYTTDRRRKEISIRKTLGASVYGLVIRMSNDFVRLTLTATVIGSVIAYYSMRQFLSQYAYHVELKWEIFVLTAGLMILISLVIVIYQVIKAASANPVDSLRNE